MEESNRQASAKASSPASASGRRLPFTQRVYELLELTDEQSQEDIISWVNDGTAFKVHDVEKFERDLLPTYFNTQKYATFTRTLCAYGFNCVRTGRQPGIYSHPNFIRNDLASLKLIKRIRKKSDPEASPKLNRKEAAAAPNNRKRKNNEPDSKESSKPKDIAALPLIKRVLVRKKLEP